MKILPESDNTIRDRVWKLACMSLLIGFNVERRKKKSQQQKNETIYFTRKLIQIMAIVNYKMWQYSRLIDYQNDVKSVIEKQNKR